MYVCNVVVNRQQGQDVLMSWRVCVKGAEASANANCKK